MKSTNVSNKCSLCRGAAIMLLCLFSQMVWATEYITDLKLVGGTRDEVNSYKSSLESDGWRMIEKDLNTGAGGDYIYLFYKVGSSQDSFYITDLFIKQGANNVNAQLQYLSRNYHLVPYVGGSHFCGQKGDLNSGTGNNSDAIHLYYTKDSFQDNRAVKSISFNGTQSGALGKNGETSGYDLNSNAGGYSVYLHFTTSAALVEGITQIDIPYQYGFENGLNGWTIADGYGDGSANTGISSMDCNTGSYSFKFMECDDHSQYLISPQITTPARLLMTFHMHGSRNKAVVFDVGVSTTTNDLEAFNWKSGSNDIISGWSWCEAEFGTEIKYIAIRSVAGSSEWYIDDIDIKELLTTPNNVVADDISSQSASLKWWGNAQSYNVRYRTKPLYYMDFEGSEIGWRVRNQGGSASTNWRILDIYNATNYVLHGYSGDYVAMARSYDSSTGQGCSVDNWFISPLVTLEGTLRYWMLDNPDKHEHYEIWVSTTTYNLSDFEKVAEPVHSDEGYVWHEYSVDLSSYNGAKGYIAFRLKDEGKDFIALDGIGIYADEWTTVTVNDDLYVMTGLTPNTSYEFQIQGVSNGEITAWTDVATFTTDDNGSIVPEIVVNPSQYNVWYGIDGHELEGEPTEPGLYIYNGKIILIR